MPGNIRLSEALDDYLRVRAGSKAATTVANESFVLRRFVAAVGRDIQVRHLTSLHVERWFYGPNGVRQPHRTRDGQQRQPVQPSTHNYYKARLASFFRYLAARGLTRVDLLASVQPMPVPRKQRQQPAPSALLAMLDCAANSRDRALLALAMNTGLRRSSLVRLRVKDVDLGTDTLHAEITKSRLSDELPISADLAQELANWLNAYARDLGRPLTGEEFLLPAASGSRYAWTTEDGVQVKGRTEGGWQPDRPVTHTERIVQHGLASLGLPTRGEGLHTLRRAVARHFFDDMVADGGYDAALRVTSAFLHHSSSATTELYLGLSSERKRRDNQLRGRPFLSRLAESEAALGRGRIRLVQ